MNATAIRNEWVIRPVKVAGKRRFAAVAKLADGAEVAIWNSLIAFPTVQATRDFIATRFDAGRAFPPAPKPVHTAAYWAEMDAIRAKHRGC